MGKKGKITVEMLLTMLYTGLKGPRTEARGGEGAQIVLISTKGRYALRVMIDLAEHQGKDYVPLKELARRQEISEKYLESIMKLLVKAKLLNGLRGKGGGYQLTRAPEAYNAGATAL